MMQDTHKAGILLVTANFMIVVQSAIAKLLTDTGLSPVEILFCRNLGGVILAAALIISLRRPELFKTARPRSHIVRSVLGNVSVGLIFWAQSMLPLATVTAIMLLSPIITTALALFLLRERISWVRIVCVFLGFVGAIVIINPAGLDVSLPYLVSLCAAVFTALVSICLRDMGSTESAWTTSFYFLGIGTILSSVVLPFVWTGGLEFRVLIGGFIVIGLLNQLLKTSAFRRADVSFLMPLKYLQIVWASLWGWLVWAEVPAFHVYLGCAIIIVSSLVIAWREQRLAAQA